MTVKSSVRVLLIGCAYLLLTGSGTMEGKTGDLQ